MVKEGKSDNVVAFERQFVRSGHFHGLNLSKNSKNDNVVAFDKYERTTAMIELDLEAMNAITEREQKLEALTADVRFLARQTAQNIIAMGKRLAEIKGLLPHGEFGPYIEEHCGFTLRTAQRFMRIAEGYNVDSLPDGVTPVKLDELLSLPAAEREEFVATHDVEDLSVRQLRAEIAKVKAERDQQAEQLRSTIDHAQHKISESELRALDWQRKAEGLNCTLDGALAENEQLRGQNEALKAQAESATPSMDAVEQHSLYRCAVSARDKAERRAQELERDLGDALETKGDMAAEMAILKAENARLKEAAQAQNITQNTASLDEVLDVIADIQSELYDLREAIADEAAGLDCVPKWAAWLYDAMQQLRQVRTIASGSWMSIINGMPINHE